MTLTDFLKQHGIEMPAEPKKSPKLPDGVRFLLFLLSRRHSSGKTISIDGAILESEWLPSITQTFQAALQEAISRKLVAPTPPGYALTDLGKTQAH
jgi:hypothetical protein